MWAVSFCINLLPDMQPFSSTNSVFQAIAARFMIFFPFSFLYFLFFACMCFDEDASFLSEYNIHSYKTVKHGHGLSDVTHKFHRRL